MAGSLADGSLNLGKSGKDSIQFTSLVGTQTVFSHFNEKAVSQYAETSSWAQAVLKLMKHLRTRDVSLANLLEFRAASSKC